MTEQASLRRLAEELEAQIDPSGGAAYIHILDDYALEVAADKDSLVRLAAAFARTAAHAEENPTNPHIDFSAEGVFRAGTDFTIKLVTYEPEPAPRKDPEPTSHESILKGALVTTLLIFVSLAVIGLISVIQWVL